MNNAIDTLAEDSERGIGGTRTRRHPVLEWNDCGNLIFGLTLVVAMLSGECCGRAATRQDRYYAHEAVEDSHGVIAPWYGGQNGQLDLRVRVGAEFLKRYPWVSPDQSVMAGPHWVFNPRVELADDGTIHVLPATPDMNGNLGQRFKYITESLPRYYRYSGDPVVFGLLKIAADYMLTYYQTPADHPWPRFPVSVPLHGTPYGPAVPGGYIQLDLSAGIGLGMLRVYQLTGDEQYLAAARHWGDVLAEKCDHRPGARPWGRYANPEEVAWGTQPNGNLLTGGVANIIIFLDELIALGYTGPSDSIVAARTPAALTLRDRLLPAWLQSDTWGRHYWDWEHPVQGILPTGWVVQYLMDHQDVFPQWKADVRNLLGLYLNRACVSPDSNGDVYSGAWAYPEGCACCGRSLDFCPLFLARYWARYGVEADSPGNWNNEDDASSFGGSLSTAAERATRATCRFSGNQIRLIGRVDANGGLADVLLDGQQQPTVIDCWTPDTARHQQVLFCRSGLTNGPHELTVVPRGARNPYSQGTNDLRRRRPILGGGGRADVWIRRRTNRCAADDLRLPAAHTLR